MIITFSESFCGSPSLMPVALVATITRTVERVALEHYCPPTGPQLGNLYAAITWVRGRRVRFTLETRDPDVTGSRRSAQGRPMRKASWEAHRDVLRALFTLDPNAVVRTALATYDGRDDFEHSHLETAGKNFGGNLLHPVPIRSTTV